MAARVDKEVLHVAEREIAISNPQKILFPEAGYTKLDLVRYYLAVSDGALRGAGGRPARRRRRGLVRAIRAAG